MAPLLSSFLTLLGSFLALLTQSILSCKPQIRSHGLMDGEAATISHSEGNCYKYNIYLRFARSTRADFKGTAQIITGIMYIKCSVAASLSPTEPISVLTAVKVFQMEPSQPSHSM